MLLLLLLFFLLSLLTVNIYLFDGLRNHSMMPHQLWQPTAMLGNTFCEICIGRIVNPKIVFREQATIYHI